MQLVHYSQKKTKKAYNIIPHSSPDQCSSRQPFASTVIDHKNPPLIHLIHLCHDLRIVALLQITQLTVVLLVEPIVFRLGLLELFVFDSQCRVVFTEPTERVFMRSLPTGALIVMLGLDPLDLGLLFVPFTKVVDMLYMTRFNLLVALFLGRLVLRLS